MILLKSIKILKILVINKILTIDLKNVSNLLILIIFKRIYFFFLFKENFNHKNNF